jgi:hypothetical protein
MVYRVHLDWVGFELITLVVKPTKPTKSYKKQEPFTLQGHITTITTAANENLGHAMDKPFNRMRTLNSVFVFA